MSTDTERLKRDVDEGDEAAALELARLRLRRGERDLVIDELRATIAAPRLAWPCWLVCWRISRLACGPLDDVGAWLTAGDVRALVWRRLDRVHAPELVRAALMRRWPEVSEGLGPDDRARIERWRDLVLAGDLDPRDQDDPEAVALSSMWWQADRELEALYVTAAGRAMSDAPCGWDGDGVHTPEEQAAWDAAEPIACAAGAVIATGEEGVWGALGSPVHADDAEAARGLLSELTGDDV